MCTGPRLPTHAASEWQRFAPQPSTAPTDPTLPTRPEGPKWNDERMRVLSVLFSRSSSLAPSQVPSSQPASSFLRRPGPSTQTTTASTPIPLRCDEETRSRLISRRVTRDHPATEWNKAIWKGLKIAKCEVQARHSNPDLGACSRGSIWSGPYCDVHSCQAYTPDGDRCPNPIERPYEFNSGELRVCDTGYHAENGGSRYLEEAKAVAAQSAILEAAEREREQQELAQWQYEQGLLDPDEQGYVIYTHLNASSSGSRSGSGSSSGSGNGSGASTPPPLTPITPVRSFLNLAPESPAIALSTDSRAVIAKGPHYPLRLDPSVLQPSFSSVSVRPISRSRSSSHSSRSRSSSPVELDSTPVLDKGKGRADPALSQTTYTSHFFSHFSHSSSSHSSRPTLPVLSITTASSWLSTDVSPSSPDQSPSSSPSPISALSALSAISTTSSRSRSCSRKLDPVPEEEEDESTAGPSGTSGTSGTSVLSPGSAYRGPVPSLSGSPATDLGSSAESGLRIVLGSHKRERAKRVVMGGGGQVATDETRTETGVRARVQAQAQVMKDESKMEAEVVVSVVPVLTNQAQAVGPVGTSRMARIMRERFGNGYTRQRAWGRLTSESL